MPITGSENNAYYTAEKTTTPEVSTTQKSKTETSKSQMKMETSKSQTKTQTSKTQTKSDRATTSTASYTQMQTVSKTSREVSTSSGKTNWTLLQSRPWQLVVGMPRRVCLRTDN
uniref:Uncharacterized protein n=1 Tax=Romanomermis culicivorax TaxID=13658 RepID=A0A915IZ55_ROMCU